MPLQIEYGLNAHMYIQLISQVLTVNRRTCSLVTMEDAFLVIGRVLAMMTVEITVTKVVSDGRWEETVFCEALIISPIINLLKIKNVCIKVVCF